MPPQLTIHHLRVSQSERICYDRSPLLAPPELASLTPMHTAPVMSLASSTTEKPLNITESGAIAEYILSVYGGDNSGLALAPTHPDFPHYLFWFHFANGTLTPALGRKMFMRLADPTLERPVHAWMEAAVTKALVAMDDRLAHTKAWLAGTDFTAADVMNVFGVTTMRTYSPVDLAPYPNILDWLKRVADREAYRLAMEKGDPDMDWKKGMSPEGPDVHEAWKEVERQSGVVEVPKDKS
ncbi:hypothetical protein LTS17_006463 [Exophiala oligosperma]